MPRKPRSHLPDGHFHVWVHAVAGDVLFHDDVDRRYFLGALQSAVTRYGVDVLSFVLLDNHVHLVVKARTAALSKSMWSLNSRFGARHNRRHDRRGYLFDGRFQCKPITDDRYLLTVLRYVARNPVEAGMCAAPEDYRWSAHRALSGRVPGPPFLDVDAALASFSCAPGDAAQVYETFVAGADPALHDLVRLRVHRAPADRPALASLLTDGGDETLRVAADRWGYTLQEIADAIGVSPSIVWRRVRRARDR